MCIQQTIRWEGGFFAQVQQERAAAMERLSSEQQIRNGWGITLAKAVAEAVVTRYLTELHCTTGNYSVHAE